MTRSEPATPPKPNRLIHEKSPYLLQHAHNPVDWYPWGEEAFAKARQEQKPIFLSIGYSTCHWCHVMEHESFEHSEIAQLMNQWFVSIKVDREEYPDVDQVYMQAVVMLTGSGGWPLNVFLTPDLKPFFGGTYFPPERRRNMAGMREILSSVHDAWQSRREQILTSAEQITASLHEQLARTTPSETISPELLQMAFNHATAAFDASRGGFGEAPKFPRSHGLSFLLHVWARTKTPQALELVTTTLDHLAHGGIHDQLGGGFHRYSTDAEWLVPHFEKMLYDQALLAKTYLEAYRITKRAAYAAVAKDTIEYVLRDLTDSHGAFYSAEDADSEGEEGKCYVWTPQEILDVLGPDEGALFDRFYGVTNEGNFEHGTSILHIEQPLEVFAHLKGFDPQNLARRLSVSRAKLFAVRSTRVRPHRDDKILTSWNGLMISTLAYAGATLDEPRYLTAASKAADFLLTQLMSKGQLLRRYRDGEARYPGTLEDYAFLSDGLFELYEATFDPRWLTAAQSLTAQMIQRFWDERSGGFFFRGKDEPPLIVSSKEIYEGATPSGSAVATLVLLKLGQLLADDQLDALGRRALDGVANTLKVAPFGYPQMLIACDVALGPTKEIIIAGAPTQPQTMEMIRAFHSRFLPRAIAILHPEGAGKQAIELLVPDVAAQGPIQGKPTAYVCERRVCQLPTTDVAQFIEALDGVKPATR